MSTEIELPQGSVEFLYADVVADVVLDAQPVAVLLGTTVTSGTWLDAEWLDLPGTSRTCRVLLDGTLAAGKYTVFVRVTDDPEIPIVKAGILRVKVN